jgi:hypothetical protein
VNLCYRSVLSSQKIREGGNDINGSFYTVGEEKSCRGLGAGSGGRYPASLPFILTYTFAL